MLKKFSLIFFVFILSFNQSITLNANEDNIGKVIKVKKGKSFADGLKLKKKTKVFTEITYSTISGGVLHLMFDEKTRLFIGNESELRIKKFKILDQKVHEVEIDLLKGSFQFKTLNKTNTNLKININGSDNFIISDGLKTNIGLLLNLDENSLKIVNIGESTLKFMDQTFANGNYGTANLISSDLSFNDNSDTYLKGDSLLGHVLGDYSMTQKGKKSQSESSGSGASSSNDGSSSGGCG